MGDNPFTKLEEEARRHDAEVAGAAGIVKARSRILLDTTGKSVFFGMLAMRLKVVPDWSMPTAAVDGVHLFYNPAFIAGLSTKEQIAVVVHEVMHCALCHHTRRNGRHPKLWNIAADLAINGILHGLGYQLPKGGLIPGQGMFAKFPPDLSAERYYEMLPKDGGAGGDDGSDPGGCGEVLDAGEDGTEIAQSEAEWQVAVAQAENAAKNRGDMPSNLQRAAMDIVHRPANWREMLRRFVCTVSRNDFSWARPNTRLIHAGIYLPSLRSDELGTVVVAVDTSGSIGEEVLGRFAAELEGILQSYQVRVKILYHDAAVAHVQEWASEDGPLVLEPKGGGGTSHVPVFNHIEQEEPPTCIICLTDGYTEYPPGGCDIPTLWAMTTDQVAPFGESIRIDAGGKE